MCWSSISLNQFIKLLDSCSLFPIAYINAFTFIVHQWNQQKKKRKIKATKKKKPQLYICVNWLLSRNIYQSLWINSMTCNVFDTRTSFRQWIKKREIAFDLWLSFNYASNFHVSFVSFSSLLPDLSRVKKKILNVLYLLDATEIVSDSVSLNVRKWENKWSMEVENLHKLLFIAYVHTHMCWLTTMIFHFFLCILFLVSQIKDVNN